VHIESECCGRPFADCAVCADWVARQLLLTGLSLTENSFTIAHRLSSRCATLGSLWTRCAVLGEFLLGDLRKRGAARGRGKNNKSPPHPSLSMNYTESA
jgi:hypothetical protein